MLYYIKSVLFLSCFNYYFKFIKFLVEYFFDFIYYFIFVKELDFFLGAF